MIYVIWQNDHITNVGLHLWWLILMGKTLLYGFKVDRLCRVFFIFNLGTPSDQLFVYWCCFQVWNIKQISDYAWLNPCIKCLFLHTKLLSNLPYNKKLNFFLSLFHLFLIMRKSFLKTRNSVYQSWNPFLKRCVTSSFDKIDQKSFQKMNMTISTKKMTFNLKSSLQSFAWIKLNATATCQQICVNKHRLEWDRNK